MGLTPKQLEDLIFGTERQRRFTQDSPVLPDVWAEYNKDLSKPVDLLLTPYRNGQPAELYVQLRERLRKESGITRRLTYNESYVVAKLTFREMVRAALPLTRWWIDYVWPEARRYVKPGDKTGEEQPKKAIPEIEEEVATPAIENPREKLKRRIKFLLECEDELIQQIEKRRAPSEAASPEEPPVQDSRAVNPSSDLLWMIEIVGALAWAAKRTPTADEVAKFFQRWLGKAGLAEALTPPAEEEETLAPTEVVDFLRTLLESRRFLEALRGAVEEERTAFPTPAEVVAAFQELLRNGKHGEGLEIEDLPRQPLLWAINCNRPAQGAVWKSSLAVKADAAHRLFEISCKGLRWAVIDSGIDATHPAFRRRDEITKEQSKETRIVETYDFTRLRSILCPEDSAAIVERGGTIRFDAEDRKQRKKLLVLRRQIQEGRMLDWDRLAELIRVSPPFSGRYKVPRNPHGTHVAGILAGDWHTSDGLPDDHDLVGMCPDLELIDLRVLGDDGQSDEFTILAALQFVRYMNANKSKPYIHGVNLSLSLLHNVMNYACGRTPVCDECHRLINTGTVVVAAAGNEGHASFLTSKGSREGYQDISITDPGNAEDVITVGATHRNRAFTYGVSYFSSRGPTGDGRIKPDLVAPGEKITGPVPGEALDTFDGTSMAAPHVSGAAALLMARHDELIGDPLRIKRILCQTATDLGRERRFQGHGMLDALRALQSV